MLSITRPSSGGGGSFASITGDPSDNAALAAVIGVNVKEYGAKGDARKVTDAVLTNNSTTVTSATAAFTSGDVGKMIWGVEAASGVLRLSVRTIASVTNSTTIVVSGVGTGIGNYSGVHLVFGTDDGAAIVAAFDAAFAAVPAKPVRMPAGGYITSRRLFTFTGTSLSKGSLIIGEGSRSTFIYPSPSFNVGAVAAGQGLIMHADSNAKHCGLIGMTIDGSYYNFVATGNHVISDSGAVTVLDDVTVQFFKGVNSGLACSGTFGLFRASRFESMNFNGVSVNGGHAHFHDCYMGNCGNYSFAIASIAGESNGGARVMIYGGTIDESTAGGLQVGTSSTDIVFIGTILFGPVGQYAARVEASCKVRFIGCQIVPFGTGNRGGLEVLSGGTAWLIGCRVAGSGTLYALDNAGTVYDGGGNVIGTITGSNPLTWIDYDRLPTSDPVVKGVVWRSGTALQVSAG
jgi:hypothetical protein